MDKGLYLLPLINLEGVLAMINYKTVSMSSIHGVKKYSLRPIKTVRLENFRHITSSEK
jgi:hypothetical protein